MALPPGFGPPEAATSLPPGFGAPERAPEISAPMSALAGATQGATAGFGDEIEGGYKTLMRKLLPESMGGAAPGVSMSEDYKTIRDRSRQYNQMAQEQNPKSYVAGEVGGSIPASLLAPEAKAIQGSRLLGVLAKGAGLGALSGLGSSEAPTVSGNLVDTLKGGAGGALASGAGEAAGQLLKPVAKTLQEAGVNMGRRVLSGGVQTIGTKTEPLAADAVEEAYRQGAIPLLGTTQHAADVLEGARETVGDRYAKIVSDLEQSGIEGPRANSLARQMVAQGKISGRTAVNPSVPSEYANASESILRGNQYPNLSAQELAAASRIGTNIPLSEAEAIKRGFQSRAKYGLLNPDPEINSARKDIASKIRQSVEDAIDQGVANGTPEQQAAGAAFVPVKEQLGRIIGASDLADRGAALAAKRGVLGMQEGQMAAGALARGMNPAGALGTAVLTKVLKQRAPALVGNLARSGGNALDSQQAQQLVNLLRQYGSPVASLEAGEHTP